MQTATQIGHPLEERSGIGRKIVIANWKLNVPDLSKWTSFPSFVQAEVVICPPFSHLEIVEESVPNIILGAQDTFWEEKGAYTGEVSPDLLKEVGVQYVIVGHSERRAMGEINEIVNKKLKASLEEGLKAILCVGETEEIKNEGEDAAKEFVKEQVSAAVEGIQTDLFRNLLIAYEPVWAISTSGSGVADTPENAAKMLRFIKKLNPAFSSSCFIYGGSVNKENSGMFLNNPDIEGALVGKASLDPEEFGAIIESINAD